MPTQSGKLVWWKIILGILLIFIEVKNHLFPTADLLKADNQTQQAGMYFMMVVLVVLGCWLVYSGIKPIWRKSG